MAEFGLTETGFSRKRLAYLLDELNGDMRSIFGDNFNVSPESPDGQINGVIAESNANLWELSEQCYHAFNPSAATGASLSNLVQLNGITRLAATSSRATLTVGGTTGTLIPTGSLVSTDDAGEQFATDSDVTLDSGGSGTVYASALTTGPIIALAGTLTQIDTPLSGWTSVTNALDADEGTDEESDITLRARRERSVARDAQAIIDAIYAAVANLTDVTKVSVLENDTNVTDANGLPPHSFHVIVAGGDETEIAETIWLKKPPGILAHGSTEIEVLDSQGQPHAISFSRPTVIEIYVEIDLTSFDDYPANGDELIKAAMVDYSNGLLVAGRGFSLGDDVIYTRLYTPINSVAGHEIDALRIGIVPSPVGTANIAIGVTEVPNFTVSNIEVTS